LQTSIALLTTHNYLGEIKSRLVFVLITWDFIADVFLPPPERLPSLLRCAPLRQQSPLISDLAIF